MTNPILAKVLSALRVRAKIGGLEISDAALRFVSFDGEQWQFHGLRLSPGVIENGVLKNHKEFVEALHMLRSGIVGGAQQRKVNAIVSLSSVNIYSQVFSLPMMEGENLEKAVQLNIQMISPVTESETYSGWQLVGEDKKAVRFEILYAFIDRTVVDAFHVAFTEAEFVVYSVEPRALSLTRVIRELARDFDRERSYIVLYVDAGGLEFIVVRRGQLYFQYVQSWQDIQGGEREISRTTFETAIVRNLHRVLNFYHTHWEEALTELYLLTGALKDEFSNVVGNNFSLTMRDPVLKLNQEIGVEWLVALGGGLRSLTPRRSDRDISLLGVSAQEEFRRYHVVDFLRFWRLVVPVALSILVVAFMFTDLFLVGNRRTLEARLKSISSGETSETAELQARVAQFNRSVTFIREVEETKLNGSTILEKVNELLEANGLILVRFYLQNRDQSVRLVGLAKSEDQIIALKRMLDETPLFASVTLPFTDIKPDPHGRSFSVSFSIVSSKIE